MVDTRLSDLTEVTVASVGDHAYLHDLSDPGISKRITWSNLMLSIDRLGTIGIGIWQGTAVALGFGGTGAASAAGARTNLNVDNQELALNNQVANYIAVLTDADHTIVEMNDVAPLNFTVPPNTDVNFPVGTKLHVWQQGIGQVTAVEGAGVTIRTPTTLKVDAQYGTFQLWQRVTDEWVISGHLSPS